ncbi:MAG TPA: isoleucine--tRNA ligase [Methanoregulaceae archaeon]|nr:isoleucine--tRNA ligase [Methanoregulaceae archaeon]
MKEVTSNYNAHEIEGEVQVVWENEKTFSRVESLHAQDPPFFFVDGPPYTTGHIHLGTAWNKIIKDSLLRYHRMCGKNVIARAGYDMHGLPIEVRVEQKLGFSTKKDIETFGIEKFIGECREFAAANLVVMSDQFKKLGVWLDFDDPYQTMDPEYIEAAWWTIQRAAERGMLERGFRVVNWCPRCATAIADAEVEYWDETDPSVFVKFPVTGKKDEYFVIWTTTPWTLPANVAVAVNPDFEYSLINAVKRGVSEDLWIESGLVEPVLKKGKYQDFTVREKKSGKELVGMAYDSPLASQVPNQRDIAHRVVAADFVARENTGIVHIAPGHGWDDYLLGQKEGLAIVCPVDATGHFTSDGGTFECMFVKDADEVVLSELGHYLMSRGSVTHRYGHCWRCKTPIIFRATSQWFLKAGAMKDRMLEEVALVKWYPEWAGSARFYDWIKEARDWCISRQRYWGIPIPIWECRSCDRIRVFGTRKELEEASGVPLKDPHRPHVDVVTVPCSCGGTMHRVEDIFDVWFDSAVASWATLRFPARHEAFDRLWPADFITEGQDQTRGWFYSQLGAGTIAFDTSPYKSVLMHGFALDAEGRKMSKSLGNVVTPEEVVAQQGVDVLRLYVLSSNAPWDDLKFNWEGIRTVNRAINIFWNVYRFPLPYMILDGWEPSGGSGGWTGDYIAFHLPELPDEDRWIISRLNSLALQIEEDLAECQLHRVTRALMSFILDDLSRWYIQIIRPRLWLEGDSLEKQQAYETLYYIIRRLVALLAPFIPHITEVIYRNIMLAGEQESVHMLSWYRGDPDLVDERLESAMNIIRSFDEAQANARQAGKRKLRWPVSECVVATGSADIRESIEQLNNLCRDRANAKSVRAVNGTYDRVSWKAEPVMKALGPAFGKKAPLVKDLISDGDGDEIRDAIIAQGTCVLGSGSESFEIDASQVTFTESLPPGIFSAPMQDATVYVDINLTPELEAEGNARELIRRIQEMRRQIDLNVEDYIDAYVMIGDTKVRDLVTSRWKQGIMEEVRATSLSLHGPGGVPPEGPWELEKDWDIEGLSITIGVSRAADH